MSGAMVIALCLLLLLEASILWRFVAIMRADASARRRAPALAKPTCNLYFLLPALREQSSVVSTLTAFTELCRGHPNARIIVITTERETYERSAHRFTESTGELTLRFMEQHARPSQIVHLHYPRTDGNKSHQLNYAIAWLKNNGATADDYVAIYDFDARPASTTIAELDRLAAAARFDALQQIPLPFGKLAQRLAAGRHWCVAESLLHVQRSLGIEKWRLQFNARQRPVLPYYLCGSGLFIRLQSITAFGELPFVDDVPYGYRLYLRGARVGVLDSYNHVEAHQSIIGVVRSNVFVFHGVTRFGEEIARAIGSGLTRREVWRCAALAVFGISEVFEFALYPLLLSAALLTGIVTGSAVLTGLAVALLMFPIVSLCCGYQLAVRETGQRWSAGELLMLMLAAPWRRFWRACGALLYVYRNWQRRLSARPLTYGKTER